MKTAKALKRIASIRKNLTLLSSLLKSKYPSNVVKIDKRSSKWLKCADKDIEAAVHIETEDNS